MARITRTRRSSATPGACAFWCSIAEVASRLFGTRITAANAITETLQRVTPEHLLVEDVRPHLAHGIRAGVPQSAIYAELAQHPLAVWVALTLGLTRDGEKWRRARPMTLDAADERLAADAGVEVTQAKSVLADFLLLAYRTTDKPPAPRGRCAWRIPRHA